MCIDVHMGVTRHVDTVVLSAAFSEATKCMKHDLTILKSLSMDGTEFSSR